MERHGHDEPALHHLQQPDSRRAARAAGRRVPRSRILSVLCQQRPADLRPGSAAMSSRIRISIVSLATALLISGATPLLAASSEADFKAAYAAAEAANKQAASLRNQWTVTAAAMADAKKA